MKPSIVNEITDLIQNLEDTTAKTSAVSAIKPKITLGKQGHHRSSMEALGDRMKEYERSASTKEKLDKFLPMMARINGREFRHFTKGFTFPFDATLHECLVATTADLVEHFEATTGYIHNDEITLVWPPCSESSNFLFNGRVVKLATVLASFAGVRFMYHLQKMDWSDHDDAVAKKVDECMAHFDARVFNVPDKYEVVNNFMWRCHFDASRNSVVNLARAHFDQEEIEGKHIDELLQMLEGKGVSWKETHPAFRWGTFVKKERYDYNFVNPMTHEEEVTLRTRTVPRVIEMESYDDAYADLFLHRFWQ